MLTKKKIENQRREHLLKKKEERSSRIKKEENLLYQPKSNDAEKDRSEAKNVDQRQRRQI